MFRLPICSFVILMSLALTSLAHVPVFLKKDPEPSHPHLLKRPYQKSIAIYTHFENPQDIDVYQFEVTTEDLKSGYLEILIGTLVPACKPLINLRTAWTLFGPNQEVIFKNENQEQGKIWYEPYTFHYYFYQKRQKLKLDQVGVYQIHVSSLEGELGDYVLEFGDQEIWGFWDIFYTLWVYPKLLLELEIQTPGCRTSNLNQNRD